MISQLLAVSLIAQGLTPQQQSSIDQLAQTFLSSTSTPGLVVSVQKGGQTVYEKGFGTELGGSTAPTPATRFQIDSLTKAFTAICVLKLSEAGSVNICAQIGEYLSLPNRSWNTITIEQLLSMTSGIPDGGTSTGIYTDVINSVAQKRGVAGIGLNFLPGSRYEYSNTNYFILGQLINKVSSQKDFGAFAKETILQPLGMADTGLLASLAWSGWATPTVNGNSIKPRDPLSGYSGGGFTSTMADLEKFAIALFNRQLLQPGTYKAMWSPALFTTGANRGKQGPFGLGWDVWTGEGGKVTRVSKNGGGYGWNSVLVIWPERGLSVIALRNSSGPGNVGELATQIGESLAN